MGLGVDSCGRSVCGSAFSTYEPRFEVSVPADYSRNNAVDAFLKFDTYCFSSWIEVSGCVVEISEDGGFTYAVAFDGTSFIAPYAGSANKVRRPDSQRLRFYIQKSGLWPVRQRILVRLTAIDDFGEAVTKVVPITWD